MNFLFKTTQKTLLSQYLQLLHVKFTPEFADKLFNGHPYKNNLYGLSSMLSAYNIRNAGVRITDKSKLGTFDPPFLVHTSDSAFLLVQKVTPTRIFLALEGKTLEYSLEEFNKIWSGVILFAEPDEHSMEPSYQKNLRLRLYRRGTKLLLSLAMLCLLFLFFSSAGYSYGIGNYILIGISIAGITVSSLVLFKQFSLQSKDAGQLCPLPNQHSQCNSVLTSGGARLFGFIRWSEIGLGYFTSNLIIALFAPGFIPYMALLNLCALPYSLWSIWYQKFRARQWCTLCLVTQLVIWLQFITNLCFGFIYIPGDFPVDTILFLSGVCLIPFLIINNLAPYIAAGIKSGNTVRELKSILMKDKVFTALLKEEGKYPEDGIRSKIIFGNPAARFTITILTNPHCNPCAAMHKKVDHLLKAAGEKICIEYIFSSFGEQFDKSGKALIGIYLNNSPEIIEKAYDEWFETGREDREKFLKKFNIDPDDPAVTEEYARHKQWRGSTRLSAAPAVLVNGYKLPQSYTLEELVYFTHIRI